MKIAAAIEKMTDFYKGNIHDIYNVINFSKEQKS